MGARLAPLPTFVQDRHWANVFALVYVAKLAVHLGHSHVTLVCDDKGALSSLQRLRGSSFHLPALLALRSFFNLLWDNPLFLDLVWCPSSLHPGRQLADMSPDMFPSASFCTRLAFVLWNSF